MNATRLDLCVALFTLLYFSLPHFSIAQSIPDNLPKFWVNDRGFDQFLALHRMEKDAQELMARAAYKGGDNTNRYAFKDVDGVYHELALMLGDVPVYRKTHNLHASEMIGADQARAHYNIDGTGVRIGLWDAGHIFAHPEFGDRYEIALDEGNPSHSTHATHVAGTLIATGLNREALGLAPEASVISYNWGFDYLEMYREAQAGLRVSNHSYDFGVGWERMNHRGTSTWNYNTRSWAFGEYSMWSYYWDSVMELNPHYLIIKAAGNEAGQGPGTASAMHYHDGDTSRPYFDHHDTDCVDGYDCMGPVASIKNGLVVGALTSEGETLADFSSRGPTLDGRIKPDVVSIGEAVYSTLNAGAYGHSSGTSMAAPTVAGSVALLLDLEHQLYGGAPHFLGSTLKALLIHTADDLGNAGPDYQYGWGRINVEKAVDLVQENKRQNERLIRQYDLTDTLSIDLHAQGGPVTVTLAWTDPVGAHPNTIRDKTRPVLVQDVDLVIEQQGRRYYPFVLDPVHREQPAMTGKNSLDNVEQIALRHLPVGPIKINLLPPKDLVDSLQVSLIITGATSPVAEASTTLENIEDMLSPLPTEQMIVYPNPVTRGRVLQVEKHFTVPQQVQVKIFDARGRTMGTIYEGYTGQLNLTLPVPTDWSPGLYVLKLSSRNNQQTEPFIVL